MTSYPAQARIDLTAIRHNLDVVREQIDGQAILAVVKADAYGHGRGPVAEAALPHVEYLGVAQLAEAIELRRQVGPEAKILAWIYGRDEALNEALAAGIELSVGAAWALESLDAAVSRTGITARVHLKADTGMARGGFNIADIPDAAGRLRRLEAEGKVRVVGLWSHLARADEVECPLTATQVERFESARHAAAQAGLKPEILHLANSAGAMWHPATRYDMVRPGIVMYGLSPNAQYATAWQMGLRAAMTLSASLIVDREVPAGTGISYGHTDVTEADGRLGVVPLGYGDGIPRAASSRALVSVGGIRTPIRGRVCMDQFVIGLPDGVAAGDTVDLFGDGESLPTADEWASACGTIGYEIVTRLGPRVPRSYHG